MILSGQTISVLQNFQTINSAIVINPGNTIKTISPTNTVFASATVPDTFEKKFAIYDLSRFLGVLSLSKQSELKFFDTHLVITQGSSKIKYTYCDPSLIVTPPEKQIKVDKEIVIDLTSDILQKVLKAMQVLGFSEIAFVGQDGRLSVSAVNSKNSSSDSFSTDLGETDRTFTCIIDADRLKLLPLSYSVSISSKGITHFYNQNAEYWIAINEKSKF